MYIEHPQRRAARAARSRASHLKSPLPLPALAALLLLGLCAPARVLCAAPAPAPAATPDDMARWLAGLPPLGEGFPPAATQIAAWRAHAAAVGRLWAEGAAPARARVRGWVEAQGLAGDARPVFYPFSGPDLLNALQLFPDSRDYLLVALEDEGLLPTPPRDARDVGESLKTLRAYLAGHLARNFFITREMSGKQGSPRLGAAPYSGVTAVLLSTLALLDYEVLSYRAVALSPSGDLEGAPAPPAPPPGLPPWAWVTGVEVHFRPPPPPGAPPPPPRRVVFLKGNLNDERLHRQRGFAAHLLRRGEFNVLVKAASYLMHMRGFDDVRSLILARARRVVMDDTAIPYRLVRERAAEWDVALFGSYEQPPPSSTTFAKHCQPDLRADFKARAPAPLPFKFGYFVTQPHLLLLTRRAGAPLAAPAFDLSNRYGVEVFFEGAGGCERGQQRVLRAPHPSARPAPSPPPRPPVEPPQTP